jgi:hypothetical protein
MTYQLAKQTKDAITFNTGMLTRVCIKNGSFEADPISPCNSNKLSTLQRSALYVIYTKANAGDFTVAITTALHSGVFDSRSQCVAVYDTLRAFGWVKEYEGRYALTSKGFDFIQNYMYSKGTDHPEANVKEAN